MGVNLKNKKLKCTTNSLNNVTRRTLLSKGLIMNRKYPPFPYTCLIREMDATTEILLGFATAEPFMALMELRLATLRAQEDSDQISRKFLVW